MDIDTQMKEIGAAVRKRRVAIDMEQPSVCDYTSEGLSIGSLSAMENGKGNLGLRKFIALLNVLGLEIKLVVRDTVK